MPRYLGPPSDHFDGKRFFSPFGPEANKTWRDMLRWKLGGSGPAKWPKEYPKNSTPNLARGLVPKAEAVVTFINHATLLLQMHGITILTDPVFSERASPFAFAGPKRVRPPGLTIDQLPQIDLVLVSHNHYDHLDLASLRELQKRFNPLVCVALGDGSIVKGVPGLRFQEMDWGRSFEMLRAKITFLPTQHWSARWTHDQNESLWGSYMIEAGDFVLYFAGDTGYASFLKDLRRKFPKIDLALLPIGAYKPEWFMKDMHMNPAEAVRAHQDLGATQSIGIHFGTWRLADEGYDEPVEALKEARSKAGLKPEQFDVLDQGESRTFRVELHLP